MRADCVNSWSSFLKQRIKQAVVIGFCTGGRQQLTWSGQSDGLMALANAAAWSSDSCGHNEHVTKSNLPSGFSICQRLYRICAESVASWVVSVLRRSQRISG